MACQGWQCSLRDFFNIVGSSSPRSLDVLIAIAMENYQHRPLSDNDFTRVLKLHPSLVYSAPLYCDLIHCKEEDFDCEALSYAWGLPHFTMKLLCNEHRSYIPITVSLDCALRRLRHPSKIRRLWVDAVCINQKNGHEKPEQIRNMTKIYNKAQQVIAWVGDGCEDGAEVLNFFQKHKDEFMALEELVRVDCFFEPDSQDPISTKAIGAIKNDLFSTFGPSGLMTLSAFFQRPWFQRRWVIQELTMAQKSSIQCGTVFMDFRSFALATKVLDVLVGLWDGNSLDPKSLINNQASDMIQAIKANQRFQSFGSMAARGYHYPILSLLHQFRHANCSDDRDRIYALLGISDDLVPAPAPKSKNYMPILPAEISINYDQSTIQVYTALAIAILGPMNSGNLAALLHIAGAFRPVYRNAADLPTWIPDWRARRRFLPMSGSYLAGEYLEEDNVWTLSKDTKVLYIRGWKYAVVAKKLGNSAKTTSFEKLRELMWRWWRFYKTIHPVEELSTVELSHNPVRRWYHFFEIVCTGGLTWDGFEQPPSDFINLLFSGYREGLDTEAVGAGLDAMLHSVVDEINPTDLVDLPDQQALIPAALGRLRLRSYIKQLVELIEGRCLCVSSNGELMNCPSDVKSGDIVVLVANFDTPFIVRHASVRSGIRGRKKGYCIIGDCYVEGIMEGQLETNEALGKPRDFFLI